MCTLGRHTSDVDPLMKMLNKGMDLARINMNYFNLNEQVDLINNIKTACKETGKDCAILVDLKGPIIRTLGFKEIDRI